MRTPHVILSLALVIACGGNPGPSSTSQPESIRSVPGSDPEAMGIAVAAGKVIPRNAKFSGVVLEGREVRALGDSVARAYRLQKVAYQPPESGRKVPFAVACAPGSAGCSVGNAELLPTYTFMGIRMSADSAFVSVGTGSSSTSPKECVALARADSGWIVAGTRPVPNYDRCP
jgi:hypothetical protein